MDESIVGLEFDGLFSVNTSASDYDTVLGIWTGQPDSLVSLACHDDVNFLGNDLLSGAEALPEFFNDTRPQPDDPDRAPLIYNDDPDQRTWDFWLDPFTGEYRPFYDPDNPRTKIEGFILNFDSFETDAQTGELRLIEDGKDRIFGDLGHDILFGGTSHDRGRGAPAMVLRPSESPAPSLGR